MSETILIYGSTTHDADLFHAVPVAILDPFLYLETGGERYATVSILDSDKVTPMGIEILDLTELGRDELVAAGHDEVTIEAHIALNACRRVGIERATVPCGFPLGIADLLRAEGVTLEVDQETFVARRRVKSAQQLDGIRRAQRAADAAMGVARELVLELREGLTSEDVRAAMQAECERHGCELADDVVVSHGPQAAVGHEPGHGPITRGEPVVVDIWPRDRASRCWADMTRTFVAGGGEVPERLAQWWALAKRSLDASVAAVRPGADCQAIFRTSAEPYIEAGIPTQLTKEPGSILREGYFHALGHGVGLEVHERPNLGRLPDTLVAGDVVALEPGCYTLDYGGCRLEDLVLVTDEGAEVLTDFPYELT